ncbi:helix-turn-helix domain-containing protein [Paraburkholderia sp. USG1]|uniref:helix-turn-helix domain-containing protein n=1 Tax=Paraburkholderia sp. USG1 TaxID=2952268 RepID=UPI002862D8AF|nr:helix-turn-helix domain-containing protein [Paraburkholderia sp. USG1]MDR8402162.1 helix-turn-helix domain-containing protein [Paraburkholderia sp. USG1]
MANRAGSSSSDSTQDETVRSAARALEVLRLLNLQPLWSLQALQQASGLPKSTLSRLLATLIHEGYVRPELPAGTYRVSSRVLELAKGYTDDSRLVDVASSIALHMTKKIKWPLALGIPDGDAIVVRYSSMPYSPIAVTGSTLGHRHAFHNSAMGQAYLAFCTEPVREAFYASLAGGNGGGLKTTVDQLRADCSRIRDWGYAIRRPQGDRESATLAMPVCRNGIAVAVLSMTTYGRSMTDTFVARHVPVLAETAEAIMRRFLSDSPAT